MRRKCTVGEIWPGMRVQSLCSGNMDAMNQQYIVLPFAIVCVATFSRKYFIGSVISKHITEDFLQFNDESKAEIEWEFVDSKQCTVHPINFSHSPYLCFNGNGRSI